jgi:hypothetical protein
LIPARVNPGATDQRNCEQSLLSLTSQLRSRLVLLNLGKASVKLRPDIAAAIILSRSEQLFDSG